MLNVKRSFTLINFVIKRSTIHRRLWSLRSIAKSDQNSISRAFAAELGRLWDDYDDYGNEDKKDSRTVKEKTTTIHRGCVGTSPLLGKMGNYIKLKKLPKQPLSSNPPLLRQFFTTHLCYLHQRHFFHSSETV